MMELPDGRVLDMQRDMVEVTSIGPRPDKRWEYTDQEGHRHQWSDGWPTLRWVVDEPAYTVEEDGYLEEYPEDGHHECAICGEQIEPGMVGPSPFREFVPGPTTYLLDGIPITEDEAHAIIASALDRDA